MSAPITMSEGREEAIRSVVAAAVAAAEAPATIYVAPLLVELDVTRATLAAEREKVRVLMGALAPFGRFADKWDAHPISRLDDRLYSIHSGDDGAEFRLSDCKKAQAALAATAEKGESNG